MALIDLPAYAAIRELRLYVSVAGQDQRRVTNRKRAPGPIFGELWRGSVAFASLNRERNAGIAAVLASCDGRVNQLKLPLTAGFASHSASANTLAATTVAGQDTITLGTGATITPGTLVTLGTIGSGTYQLLEIVASVSSTVHHVAPRVRYAFSSGATLAIGSVTGLFEVATDELGGVSHGPSYGSVAVDLIEAI